MTIMYNDTANTFDVFQKAMNIILESENVQDLCRKLVHSDLLREHVRGAHVYTLNNRSCLQLAAGYGEPYVLGGEGEFSAWDDNPASNSIRTKTRVFVAGSAKSGEFGLVCVPFVKESVPIGCCVLMLSPDYEESPISAELAPALSRLGAYFLETKGFSSRGNGIPNGRESVEDLTTRQMTILTLMDDGLTNFEISQQVLLSESTVRQETIRIYRALACQNRVEAVAKARAMGVLPRLVGGNTDGGAV